MPQQPIASAETGSAAAEAEHLLAGLVRETLLEKRRARRWAMFRRVLTLLWITALLLWLVIAQKPGEDVPADSRHTALIDINGVVAEGQSASVEPVLSALERALDHAGTAGVILRINSPGGSPVQAGILFDAIRRERERHPDTPVHAVLGDIAASGGYYIAVAADNIYANQASIVGSIGVRLDSFGATEALEKLGLERRLLTAGENKALLDPFLPEDPVAVAHLQSMIDAVHAQFIDAVKRGRGTRLADNDQLFTGLVWNGEQAVELGLVDALADTRTVARDVIGEDELVDFTEYPDVFRRLSEQFGVGMARGLTSGWPRGWQ